MRIRNESAIPDRSRHGLPTTPYGTVPHHGSGVSMQLMGGGVGGADEQECRLGEGKKEGCTEEL